MKNDVDASPLRFEACGANIDDFGENNGHWEPRVRGKGDEVALMRLPPAP